MLPNDNYTVGFLNILVKKKKKKKKFSLPPYILIFWLWFIGQNDSDKDSCKKNYVNYCKFSDFLHKLVMRFYLIFHQSLKHQQTQYV